MYFTSGNDRAFEQPQPRPEQPDEAAPGLENSVLENPTSDNPTPGNPTLENPMQLNKDHPYTFYSSWAIGEMM